MTNTSPYVSSTAAPEQLGNPALGYPQAAPYAPLQPYSGKAIAGFVLSLLGVSVVGVILSVLGLKETNNGAKRGHGLAIAGIIIGALGVVWQIILLVSVFAGLAVESSAGAFA